MHDARRNPCFTVIASWICLAPLGRASPPASPGAGDLIIARRGRTGAVVVVAPEHGPGASGPWERRAAADLVEYIERMTGARPRLADTPRAIEAALEAEGPVLIVGREALRVDPSLRRDLAKVARKEPVLRADAILVRRRGRRVFLAGTNDDSHYYAVAYLLERWGCRWYMPTAFGECIPHHEILAIGDIDHAYAPPFEVRHYWLSWYGDRTGEGEFKRRNMMNDVGVPSGHALARYTRDLVPPGGSPFHVPIAEDATAEHVAGMVAERFAAGHSFSLSIEDGAYTSDSPVDAALASHIRDKSFLVPSLSDPFLVFYNKVSRILTEKYPGSDARIGFLAYTNITLPPQREIVAEKPLVAYLAAIDIDPIHGMDDPRSPARQEYREVMERWSEVMQGRLVIYDYDQGMLVWRDIPNPSIQSIRRDIKHYRDAGILGIATESRNAIATTFLDLHVRGRLMWDPDADVDALVAEFFPKFYGPAAEPMARYWGAIFEAWEDTIATEHEFFVAPAVYTPDLVAELRGHLEAAEAAFRASGTGDLPIRERERLRDRMRFTRLGFEVLENYVAMTRAAATEVDYRAAVAFGERGLAARDGLTAMNGIFTTTRLEKGRPWWPGEVQTYRELLALTDGRKGTLIAKLPLQWAFHRDPNDTGLARGWAYRPADLTYWKGHREEYDLLHRKDYPVTEWEVVRTDLYPQAQGILHPDGQSYTGFSWYKAEVDLEAAQTGGEVHVRFPGLFGKAWLYVNGYLVAHRPQDDLWWRNDYRFAWDVDVSGKLEPGRNDMTLRNHNILHMSGMFRRPFLYRVTGRGAAPPGRVAPRSSG